MGLLVEYTILSYSIIIQICIGLFSYYLRFYKFIVTKWNIDIFVTIKMPNRCVLQRDGKTVRCQLRNPRDSMWMLGQRVWCWGRGWCDCGEQGVPLAKPLLRRTICHGL